jgi:hypothetical protein
MSMRLTPEMVVELDHFADLVDADEIRTRVRTRVRG